MRGAEVRQRRERALVWYGAMLPYLKNPLSLSDFVGGPSRVRAQSPAEMQANCEALAAAWGAEWVTQ